MLVLREIPVCSQTCVSSRRCSAQGAGKFLDSAGVARMQTCSCAALASSPAFFQVGHISLCIRSARAYFDCLFAQWDVQTVFVSCSLALALVARVCGARCSESFFHAVLDQLCSWAERDFWLRDFWLRDSILAVRVNLIDHNLTVAAHACRNLRARACRSRDAGQRLDC